MLKYLIENSATVVVGLVVLIVFAAAVVKLFRDKLHNKNACGSCSGCSGSPGSSTCGKP